MTRPQVWFLTILFCGAVIIALIILGHSITFDTGLYIQLPETSNTP